MIVRTRLSMGRGVMAGLASAFALTQVPAGASGGAFGSGAAGFVTSSAPAALSAQVDQAGEPSIGVNWNTGKAMYMDGSAVARLSFDGAGAVTWTDASPLGGTIPNLDPILVTEPRSGLTLAGGDDESCGVLFSSTDDGANWLPSLPCPGPIDHPTVGYAPSTLQPGSTVYYYCQHTFVQQCVTSTTNGQVWTPAGVSTGGPGYLPICEYAHGHLRGSADGSAYLPGKGCVGPDGVNLVGGLITSNDGLTWTQYLIPGAISAVFDPAVATTPDNTVYEAWQSAANNHPLIASSRDHGATWSAPVDLASTVSPGLVAATFPTLTAGDNGRIAYSFLGTSIGSGNPHASGFQGVWYLYTSFSYDGGETWTTVQDSPDPVQYGEIDAGGVTSSGQRNLLDFIDSSVTEDGRVVVAYADGCLADCEAKGAAGDTAGAVALSTHAWASVAYQTEGKGLFAAYDAP